MTKTERILDLLYSQGENSQFSMGWVCRELGVDSGPVSGLMSRLMRGGHAKRVSHGVYRLLNREYRATGRTSPGGKSGRVISRHPHPGLTETVSQRERVKSHPSYAIVPQCCITLCDGLSVEQVTERALQLSASERESYSVVRILRTAEVRIEVTDHE